ncbi:MAG TPA: ATP-binding cassette domain-containing protein [Thermoanaerobaculia bacterium]
MLDVSLHSVSNFALHDVTLHFAASSHTAIVGPPASGASTLLQLIAGTQRPKSGEIRIGTRVVTNLRASQRPVLFVTSAAGVPLRWSVRHALVAAVRSRSLDRVDRQHEYELAVDKWNLRAIIDRTISTLSASEQTLAQLARIELLRPGILIADRLLERLNAAASEDVIDMLYRTLRVAGTTVISAPASRAELGATDHIVVFANGRVVQEGTAAQVYTTPTVESSAAATGAINVIPVSIEGSSVESVIGAWEVDSPPFQGSGVALVRPEAFSIAEAGAESDLIVAVEEAAFENGRWLVRAMLSGSLSLRISLAAKEHLHKGKLLALTYQPAGFPLIPREIAVERRSVPTSMIPPMSSSR